ncbi:MAG TPA: ABC transporter permease [Terracidiphilus sp.]|jgi:hypothetical protein
MFPYRNGWTTKKVGWFACGNLAERAPNLAAKIQGKPDNNAIATFIKANAEHFSSVGTRVVMGRGIRAADTADSQHVAVVNKEFVKQMFKPGENPIGQHFGWDEKAAGDWEIVGVVENTAY